MEQSSFQNKFGVMIHTCKWPAQGTTKAIVQIVHGIADHTRRYTELAEALCRQGITVVGEDHMGHGLSAGKSEMLGHIRGGWLDMTDDTHQLLLQTKKEYPGVPYFLFGHSMGSFMVLSMLYRYSDMNLSGAILSGTGWQSAPLMAFGRTVTALNTDIYGKEHTSRLLNNLMFDAYVKQFPSEKSKYCWVNSDPSEVAKYEADPFCGFSASNGLIMAMMNGISDNHKPGNLRNIPSKLPVLLYAGDHDPVGDMGEGVKKAARALENAGVQSVRVQLFPGRHEMHCEPNKQEVYALISDFIESYIR